jgi:hypothetical protein
LVTDTEKMVDEVKPMALMWRPIEAGKLANPMENKAVHVARVEEG